MGKYLNVLGGIVLIVAAIGMLALNPMGVKFWDSFVTLIVGAIPPMLGMIGLILLFIGLEEMKSETTAASMPAEPVAPLAPAVPEIKEPAYEIHSKKKRRR